MSTPYSAGASARALNESRGGLTWPTVRLSDGVVEGLKWLAVGLMVLDHVDKYLLQERVRPLFDLGRSAFPLFAFILAYNLARPGALERGSFGRAVKHLMVAGAVAELPFTALGGLAWGWYPLNILWTFVTAVAVMWLMARGGPVRTTLAIVVFLVGGAFVEFWWAGVALVIASWWYCRRPSASAFVAWMTALASLYLINRNWWAFAAIPLLLYATHARWAVPRVRWAFYVFYPAHLAALLTLKVLLHAT